MGQSLYRTDVFVDKDTDEIAPDIRNHDDGEQIGHTLTIPDMRAFNVEAARLQPLKSLSAISCGTSRVLPRRCSTRQGSAAQASRPCL